MLIQKKIIYFEWIPPFFFTQSLQIFQVPKTPNLNPKTFTPLKNHVSLPPAVSLFLSVRRFGSPPPSTIVRRRHLLYCLRLPLFCSICSVPLRRLLYSPKPLFASSLFVVSLSRRSFRYVSGFPNQEHHSPARVDGILYYSFSYAFDIPHYLVLYNICTFLF